MKLTNKLNYPLAYVEAAKKHIYPKKAERIGATTLIDSPQIRRLTIEHWDELEQDMEGMFVAMLGTAWHKFLETHAPKTIGTEKKWEHSVNGLVLVGVADVVAEGIEDYKLVSAWSWVFGEKEKWEQQLNILNYLQNKVEGKNAEYLRIHAFVKDWSSYKAMQDKDYPQRRFFNIDFKPQPLDVVEKFIEKRIEMHKDTTYECTDKDKWIRIKNYAIKKRDAKRATRCFNKFGECEEYIVNNNLSEDYGKGKYIIECRKTEPRRCAEFCACKNVCPFGKTLKN